MRPSVQAAFVPWVSRFEGVTNWPYLDVKGLVTTGIGNLIDPFSAAKDLPWTLAGMPATGPQIAQAWLTVKGRQDLRLHGGGAFKDLTQLRLSAEAVNDLCAKKLAGMDQILCLRFAGYEDYPADAQLGILSMAWALGPAFDFPAFHAACEAGDWVTASQECHIRDANPARNTANQELFLLASRAADPSVLSV